MSLSFDKITLFHCNVYAVEQCKRTTVIYWSDYWIEYHGYIIVKHTIINEM